MNRSLRRVAAALARAGVAIAVLVAGLSGQEIPQDEYLRYLPFEVPRMVGQTDASAALHLYGDTSSPGYFDTDPRDGIDDQRLRVLERLGLRFAPFLVQSSELVPLDFRHFRDTDGLALHVDTWETALSESLVSEETIEWLDESRPACPSEPNGTDDCRLLELLDAYHPGQPSGAIERARAARPPTDLFEVLWLSFPGEGPRTWKDYYRDDDGRLRADLREHRHTYVHPFLEHVPSDGQAQLYDLILQYWFFYPYNDGGNNHEGDWEHINVIVSPRDRVTVAGLTARTLGRILNGDGLEAAGEEELVIKRVEFFFHGKVITLDYSSPNAYANRTEWRRQVETSRGPLVGDDYWAEYIRFTAYRDDAETQVNTHPIGYIGADNKGLDQLLSAPGGNNRDSHGTYPAPGLFKDIGPGGAAEAIHTSFNHRDFFAASPDEQREIVTAFKRGSPVFLGEPGMVEIVPDYEPVIDLTMIDVDVRRRWAWLFLPIRWGYPATESPLAGIVPHAETGNISILGPAFNSGWNRSGATSAYETYEPHVLPRLFPTQLQDAFSNDLGFLNATGPTLSFLPPFDVLWRVVAAPIRAIVSPLDRMFIPSETVPYRFIGVRAGVATHAIRDDYADLLFNEVQGPQLIQRLIEHTMAGGPATEVAGATTLVENQTSPIYLIDLYVGTHLVTTNGLRHGRSRIGSTLSFSDIPPFAIESELNMWEYSGSIRYNVLAGGVQPFTRLGYGLTWYRLEDTSTNGEPLETPQSEWVRQPSLPKLDHLLPSTWHFGLGLEFVPIRRFASLPRGIDLGLTVEWQYFSNNLGLDAVGVDIRDLVLLGVAPDDLPRERRIGRHSFSATIAVSF